METNHRSVVSPDVPGWRITSQFGAGSIVGMREVELISWGQDLDALAEQRKIAQAENASREKLAHFHDDTLTDAESDNPERRARGLQTAAMNQFPPDKRERLERAIRAGLAQIIQRSPRATGLRVV
jgi:hypothetical protein